MSAIDVTVVVPVYNPGQAIDSCIASLLAQSLPADRLEIIFSDDGSTDGTGDKLDRVAAEHPHVSVIHSPNSGWPGRPRNLGIEAATGEYIQFVDHDDSLAPRALEKLVAYGRDNAADIVIGKVTSDFRQVPHSVFRENVAACTIWNSRITSSLTPHKMFRRQFLIDTAIRFPEGKVRLEDQLFVMKTYFAASSVAVLSDYPCYFYRRRADGSNAAGQAVEPAVYYHYAREVLDVVVDNTEPGDLRTLILRRFWRAAIDVCGKAAVRRRPPGHLEKLHPEVLRLYADYIPAEIEAGLMPFRRAQAWLMHRGELDRLAALTRHTALTSAAVRLETLDWTGSAWRAQVTARLVYTDGTPLTAVPSGSGWRPDPRIIPLDIEIAPQRLEEMIEDASIEATVRHRDSGVRWFVPGEWTPSFEPATSEAGGPVQLVYTGVIELDPATIALGGPLTTGQWDLFVGMHAYGVGGTASGAVHREPRPPLTPVLVRPRARVVRLRVPDTGRVSLVVRSVASAGVALARRVTALSVSHGTVTATIAMRLAGGPATTKCEVLIGPARVAATIRATSDGAQLCAGLAGAGRLPRGRHAVRLAVGSGDAPRTIGVLSVGRWGRMSISGDAG